MTQADLEAVLRAVRRRGGRATATRRIVLEALAREGASGATGITAERLNERIRAEHPSFSDSTVYRSLERFEELGVATHAHLGHGPAVWRLADQPRWYVVCSSCQRSVDVEPDLIEPLVAQLLTRVGFSMDGHFAITGLCAACSGREEAGR